MKVAAPQLHALFLPANLSLYRYFIYILRISHSCGELGNLCPQFLWFY